MKKKTAGDRMKRAGEIMRRLEETPGTEAYRMKHGSEEIAFIEREYVVRRTMREYVRIKVRIAPTPSSALNEEHFQEKATAFRKMVTENPNSFFWLQTGYTIDEKETS